MGRSASNTIEAGVGGKKDWEFFKAVISVKSSKLLPTNILKFLFQDCEEIARFPP